MRLPDKLYDVLKWVCLICLPAMAALYTLLAKIWGWPFESEVPATINAIAVFIGTLIGISHIAGKQEVQDESN